MARNEKNGGMLAIITCLTLSCWIPPNPCASVTESLSGEVVPYAIRGIDMAEIPDSRQHIELMVNCKTYPAVSTKYTETVYKSG